MALCRCGHPATRHDQEWPHPCHVVSCQCAAWDVPPLGPERTGS